MGHIRAFGRLNRLGKSRAGTNQGGQQEKKKKRRIGFSSHTLRKMQTGLGSAYVHVPALFAIPVKSFPACGLGATWGLDGLDKDWTRNVRDPAPKLHL